MEYNQEQGKLDKFFEQEGNNKHGNDSGNDINPFRKGGMKTGKAQWPTYR